MDRKFSKKDSIKILYTLFSAKAEPNKQTNFRSEWCISYQVVMILYVCYFAVYLYVDTINLFFVLIGLPKAH